MKQTILVNTSGKISERCRSLIAAGKKLDMTALVQTLGYTSVRLSGCLTFSGPSRLVLDQNCPWKHKARR